MTYIPYIDERPVIYSTTTGRDIDEPNLECTPAKRRMRIVGDQTTFPASERHRRLFQHAQREAESYGEKLEAVIRPAVDTYERPYAVISVNDLNPPYRIRLFYSNDRGHQAALTADNDNDDINIHVETVGMIPIHDLDVRLAENIRLNPWSLARSFRLDSWIAGGWRFDDTMAPLSDVIGPFGHLSGWPMPIRVISRSYGTDAKVKFTSVARELADVSEIRLPTVDGSVHQLTPDFSRESINVALDTHMEHGAKQGWHRIANQIEQLISDRNTDVTADVPYHLRDEVSKIAGSNTETQVVVFNQHDPHPVVLHIPTMSFHTICRNQDPSQAPTFEFELEKARIQGLEKEFLAHLNRSVSADERQIDDIVADIQARINQ